MEWWVILIIAVAAVVVIALAVFLAVRSRKGGSGKVKIVDGERYTDGKSAYTADGNTYAGKMEKTVVVKEAEQPSDSSSDSSSENVSSDSSDPDGSSVIASSSGGSGTKTGCGSVAGMAGIAAAAIFVGGLAVKAKRKDNE